MSTEKQTIQNTEKQTTEITQKIATVLLHSVMSAIDKVNEYKDFANVYVNNPFYIAESNNAVEFKIDLQAPVKLPRYLSYFIFGAPMSVYAIEIKGAFITLYCSNNSIKDRYTIELDSERLPVLDIAILLHVLNDLSMDNTSMIVAETRGIKNAIDEEKGMIVNLLKANGIEINE